MKRFFTILCGLVLSVTLFAGCNLTSLNKAKYYQTVAVTVEGNEGYASYNKKYTREDVLNAFYNYSYSNVSQGSVTAKDGLDSAINTMIERDLLINYVKAEYFDKGILTFSSDDEKTARYNAFSYMQKQIYEYEDEVREEWEMNMIHDHDDEEESSEESTSRATYDAYEPTLEIVYGDNGEINFRNLATTETTTVKFDVPEKFADYIHVTDEDVSAEAYARYVAYLQSNAKALGKSTKESDVINAEVERLTKLYTESQYITIFENYINNLVSFDENDMLSDTVISNVLQKYRDDYRDQKNLYEDDEDAYHEAMAGDDISGIYYHKQYAGSPEYMYVSHILIKFSDKQTKLVENYKKELENGTLTQSKYEEKLENLVNSTVVTYEENGVAKTTTAAKVYDKVVNYVDTFGANEYERAELFNDMIYMFNDDEGIMNKDFAYVVNLDENVEDKMVAEFANACRDLDKNEGIGAIDQVVSEYGLHIIFHAGYVESPNPESMTDAQLLESLVEQKTQLSSQKSLFNLIYDSIVSSSNSTRENNIISEAKSNVKVVIYTKKCKSIIEN